MSYDQDRAKGLMVDLVNTLPGYEPLEIPSVSSNAAERFALASMYKEKGYRDYLTRAIRLNISRLLDVTDMMSLNMQQGRILVLKELLALSQQMFTEAGKIDKSFTEDIETKA